MAGAAILTGGANNPAAPLKLRTGAIATWLLREAAKMEILPDGVQRLLDEDYFNEGAEYRFELGDHNARIKLNGEANRIEGYLFLPQIFALQEDYLMYAPQPESVAAQHIEQMANLTLRGLVERQEVPALQIDHIQHTSDYTYYSFVQQNGPTFERLLAEIQATRRHAG